MSRPHVCPLCKGAGTPLNISAEARPSFPQLGCHACKGAGVLWEPATTADIAEATREGIKWGAASIRARDMRPAYPILCPNCKTEVFGERFHSHLSMVQDIVGFLRKAVEGTTARAAADIVEKVYLQFAEYRDVR